MLIPTKPSRRQSPYAEPSSSAAKINCVTVKSLPPKAATAKPKAAEIAPAVPDLRPHENLRPKYCIIRPEPKAKPDDNAGNRIGISICPAARADKITTDVVIQLKTHSAMGKDTAKALPKLRSWAGLFPEDPWIGTRGASPRTRPATTAIADNATLTANRSAMFAVDAPMRLVAIGPTAKPSVKIMPAKVTPLAPRTCPAQAVPALTTSPTPMPTIKRPANNHAPSCTKSMRRFPRAEIIPPVRTMKRGPKRSAKTPPRSKQGSIPIA